MVTVAQFNTDTVVAQRRDLAPGGLVADHSLIRTASPGSSADTRWLIEGVNFVPTLCTTLHNQPLPAWCTDFTAPGTGDGPTYQTCPGPISFKPFVAEIAIDVRYLPTVTKQNWVTDRLVLGLSQLIESILWPAADPGRPWLGGGTSVTPPTSGGAVASVGAIETAILSAKAGSGVIHMSPVVAAQAQNYLVNDDMGTLRTRGTGAKVVVGNYPSTKIAGHIGDIDLYLGPSIFADEAFDRTTNHTYQHAWLEAAAAWHTCAAWVLTLP